MADGRDSGGEVKGEFKVEEGCFDLLDKVQVADGITAPMGTKFIPHEFCMSQFLEEDFEQFARKHHETFLDTAIDNTWSTAGGVEHKLEYTEVYNLFLEHFEARISGFIEEEEGTVEQFQRECKDALGTLDEHSPRRFFIEILLATTDYGRFYFLMVAEAKKIRRENPEASSHK